MEFNPTIGDVQAAIGVLRRLRALLKPGKGPLGQLRYRAATKAVDTVLGILVMEEYAYLKAHQGEDEQVFPRDLLSTQKTLSFLCDRVEYELALDPSKARQAEEFYRHADAMSAMCDDALDQVIEHQMQDERQQEVDEKFLDIINNPNNNFGE